MNVTETDRRTRRGRNVRRGIAAAGIAAAGLVAWTLPSQAQDAPTTPTTNFSMAGIADASTGTLLSVDKQISGEFQYCSNANGLGAELYLNAGDGAGMAVEQATVTPFVLPLHIGVVSVNNPDPENEIKGDRFFTIGVVKGTPIDFGKSGQATVEYGGVFLGPKVGLINWNYSADVSCDQSRATPIISALMASGQTTATTVPATTVPDTTVPDTTVPAGT